MIATVTDATAGNSSLTVSCEMTQGGKLTVRGKAVLVHLDTESKRPSRIPDSLREKLAAAYPRWPSVQVRYLPRARW